MSPTKVHADSDDDALDDAAVAAIANAAEWGADDKALAAIADAAVEDKQEWDAELPEDVKAYVEMNERRAYKEPSEEPQPSAAVQIAIASDRSRSPPTRRGGFQSHPPIPKPLPQIPAPRIAYTPTATPEPKRWTLDPSTNCRIGLSQPLEELSPPPIALYDSGWVAGRRVLKEEEPKPKPKRIRIDVEDDMYSE